MFFKRVFLFASIVIIYSCVCSAKIQTEIVKPSKLPTIIPVDVNYSKFHVLLSALKDHCNITTSQSDVYENNSSILVKDHGVYLKIDFRTKKDFKSHSFRLTKEAKEKLKCIAPHILADENAIVQIVGHANDSISMNHNQYLSHNRAISAAELFYTENIKNEILAKGCPEEKVLFDEIVVDDSFIDRSIVIYIYNYKLDVQDPCSAQ